jgi:hypothetical protein
VLGVDPNERLVALRVDLAPSPPPVAFGDAAKVAFRDKLHIIRPNLVDAGEFKGQFKTRHGTPGGGTLKKTLNKGDEGAAVADASGVVGIATGGDQVVSSEVIKHFLAGKIATTEIAKPRVADKKTVAGVTVTLIDPLQNIKQVGMDVWTGPPTPRHIYSLEQPKPYPNDSPRQSQRLTLFGASGIGDITLPIAVPSGHVVWMQPVITLADNSQQWGDAAVVPIAPSPYDRQPTILTANVVKPDQRTVTLKATHVYNFKDADKKPITMAVETTILEVMGPDPNGATMRLGIGPDYQSSSTRDGKKTTPPKMITDYVRLTQNTYFLDAKNRQLKRTFDPPTKMTKEVGDQVGDEVYRVTAPLEAMMIPLPNKQVQPGESWETNVGIVVRPKKEGEVALKLKCTYEGLLKKDKKVEAIVTVAGKVEALNAEFKAYDGEVSGKYGFDPINGIITSGQLKLASPAGPDMDSYVLDIELTRVAGNPNNLKLPPDPKDVPVAKGKVIFETKGIVNNKDGADPAMSNPKKKQFAHYKAILVPLEAGKTYAIQIESTAFDPFLKVFQPGGMMVAQVGNMGPGTKVVGNITATANGNFTVWVISRNTNVGGFQLKVTELTK